MKWGWGDYKSANPLVQHVGLLRRKNREEQDISLEGPKALRAPGRLAPERSFLSLAFNGTAADDEEKGWRGAGDERVLLSMADTATPQELIAVLDQPQSQLDQALKQGTLWLVIDGIQDPGNLGTMLRTAVAAGASGVLMTKGTVDPYNPKAARASAGALSHPHCDRSAARRTLAKLGERKSPHSRLAKGKIPYFEIDMTARLALAIGSEGRGLSPVLLESSQVVAIPQAPGIDSLNAAIAAAILCFEGVRQKLQRGVQPFPL